MILVVTFSSLNPWVSRESLNLILGQKGQIGCSLLSFVGVLVIVNEAVQTSGQRCWEAEHFLCRVFLSALVSSPWHG